MKEYHTYLKINDVLLGRVIGWHKDENQTHWVFEMYDGYQIRVNMYHMNFGLYDDAKIHALDIRTFPM